MAKRSTYVEPAGYITPSMKKIVEKYEKEAAKQKQDKKPAKKK